MSLASWRRPFAFLGRLFAEQGYQAVIQGCRRTLGSGGAFGPSSLGLTRWAVAGDV